MNGRAARRYSILLFSWLLALATPAARGQEFTFRLIPEELWTHSSRSEFLPSGRVFLYRAGAYRPDLVLTVNEPGKVPPGSWLYVAEFESDATPEALESGRPHHVSVFSGRLVLPEEPAEGAEELSRTFLEPVVPACRIDLGDAEGWRGVSRLDAVSLDRRAVYPVIVKDRRRFLVPAGRFLAYAVDARGVMAISPVTTCRSGETVQLPRPEPPPGELQDLMVSVRLPAEVPDLEEELTARLAPLRPGGPGGVQVPSAVLRVGSRATFFFLGASAREPLALRVTHPQVLTHRHDLSPLEGAVRELPHVQLKQRVTLELAIDYRPGREHARQELVLLHCGERPRRSLIELDPRECTAVAEPRQLAAGPATYRFEDLDLGWYVPEARIDDEKVLGLGNWYSINVDGESPPVVSSPVQRLEELEIYGHLLLDGEPVAGEVRLEGDRGELRRFPTDDELEYHMYYFGQLPTSNGLNLLPEEQSAREAEELRGMFSGYALRACDEEGFCKLFHHFSTFSGAGRYDLDLGAGRELEVEVVDADSLEAVVGAMVTAVVPGEERRTVHYVGGEVFEGTLPTVEARLTLTDQDGRVRLRDLQAGEQRLTVFARGYGRLDRTFSMPGQGRRELRVELEHEDRKRGLAVRFPDRQPASRAFFLALGADGTQDHGCSRGANGEGEVRFPGSCLADDVPRRFVLLHPAAAVEVFSGAQLRQVGQIEATRSAGLPLELRLLDGAGEPLRGRPVTLRFQDFTLYPAYLASASFHIGEALPYRTDERGAIALSFLNPRWPLPEVGVDAAEHWFAIPPAGPGQAAELWID